jgi:chlorite dismutase
MGSLVPRSALSRIGSLRGMRMETGVCVLHLFCTRGDGVDRSAFTAAIDEARARDLQVMTASILGHKADLAVMALGPDVRALRDLQTALQRAGVAVVDSYLSITEVSEYAKGLPEHMLTARLYPQLPPEGKPAFCFYPMSKRREAHANWYATPFEERLDMMMEHGTSGRKFAGRVLQLVTASTGLDDFEWGVTLFANDLDVIKDVVYTMRFDRGSALYGEFGRFFVGYLDDIENLV